MRTKTKISILSALMVLSMFAMAVMPASASPGATTASEETSTNPGPTNSTAITTEGGNITNVNLVAYSYTECWAGFYGNVSGTINLTDDSSHSLYSWDWVEASGGEVIASTGSTITWASLVNGTAAAIDSAWGFTGSDKAVGMFDDTTNTFTIGDITLTSAPAVTTTGLYNTSIVNDGAATKTNHLFVVSIINDGETFNTETHDFEMIVPTDDTIGETETYYFYVELS